MAQENNDLVMKVVAKALRLPIEEITDEISQESTGKWNSIRHLLLVTELEKTFGVSLTTQEIIALKNMRCIKQTLRGHGVDV